MILDLMEFFLKFENQTYCIVKPDEQLPSYTKGSDLDIFCYDTNVMVKSILDVGNQYVDKGLEILISKMDGQVYVDFIHKESKDIEFRFDLYNKLPTYHNVLIKSAFFESVLEHRITINLYDNINTFAPNSIDDNILRYIEYQEWYGQRPDKIKHINYILESCDSTKKNKFLEKLHHYTRLPEVESIYPKKQKKINIIKLLAKKILSKLPGKVKIFIKKFI